MKTNLIGLAVALTSFAAFADDWSSEPCDSTHAAAPVAVSDGRYELRDTQQWIAAHYETVTIQECEDHGRGRGFGRHHHNRWQRCFPVTTSRLVPGFYQTVQEWVWVPTYPEHHRYSTVPPTNPPMQGRIGFRFGVR